jgi:hypothetical protein
MKSTAEGIIIARCWFIVVGLIGVLLGLGGSLTWRRLWMSGWGVRFWFWEYKEKGRHGV